MLHRHLLYLVTSGPDQASPLRNNKPRKAPHSPQGPNQRRLGLSLLAYHLAHRHPRQAFFAQVFGLRRFRM